MSRLILIILGASFLLSIAGPAVAQIRPDSYDSAPPAESPYYRVRYEASSVDGELDLAVQYTVWIPPSADRLRGVIVHQHGCGHWSASTGMTGAYDLHWQALAIKHDCALFSAAYEIAEGESCLRWRDPARGSEAAFLRSLEELGQISGHSELADVPWALWGHSGGGYWVGTMTLLHPDRVAAVWMKSGGPNVFDDPIASGSDIISVPEAAYAVPMMLHIGTKEGVTEKDGRFARLWPYAQKLLNKMRSGGGLFGLTVDPLTEHTSGNQRYVAIPWLDTCLESRLPVDGSNICRAQPTDPAWLARLSNDFPSIEPVPKGDYEGNLESSIWLPNKSFAEAWRSYIIDAEVPDKTAPPAPKNVRVVNGALEWDATADIESGIRHFIVLLDGEPIASVPRHHDNPYGRELFQGLSGSDTPRLPLRDVKYEIPENAPKDVDRYRVLSVNTAGLSSDANDISSSNR
ncbi:MAG: hypothetical protein AAF532_15900 [Planctomycetota bacterium]